MNSYLNLHIKDLPTPCHLLNLNALENNIRAMAELCGKYGVELWPMVKTHKSLEIAKLQMAAGAKGFLTGTLDEAEILINHGYKNIMLAYPVTDMSGISRIMDLAKKAAVIVSLDGLEAAKRLNNALEKRDIHLPYLLIIDCGLHRLGISLGNIKAFMQGMREFSRLKFVGISSHPGQVYGASNQDEVKAISREEVSILAKAREILINEGYEVQITASGSTPTAAHTIPTGQLNIYRPGNYVFYDSLQAALGVTDIRSCSLTVLASVISHPQEDLLIIDAGSKCLGLDKGAHGISLLKGYGEVLQHPELTVSGLSEEVGKVKIEGHTNIKVGDKIEIVPNHSCSAANLTSYLVTHRNGKVEGHLAIEMRSNSLLRWPQPV